MSRRPAPPCGRRAGRRDRRRRHTPRREGRALVAQQEREAISRRTKEALAIARSRGVKLGNPNGAAALRRSGKGGAALRATIARNADRHAQDLAPVVEDIRAGGAASLRAIAAEMND